MAAPALRNTGAGARPHSSDSRIVPERLISQMPMASNRIRTFSAWGIGMVSKGAKSDRLASPLPTSQNPTDRLLSIESELAIAREIQTSILPRDVPELSHVQISAAYCPMTAVAGDFYWFIAIDPHRAGFFVADVAGHGVPAALIASMIKVAMQAAVTCANDPQSVLRGVERALSGQQRGQFVSAAYLWLDTENRKALYSAAGHPPLLRWSQGKLESIQSNELLFGVMSGCDYPVCEISIAAGDRFLLYTDGLIEPENVNGESFGERKLEEVVRECQSLPAFEVSDRLLFELRHWQPASAAQQDDITLIVIDVL